MENKRGQWGTNMGFLMAAVGSAVGLGNIWGFPYKMGANGGFAFLLVYIVLAVFVGFTIMLGEFVLGRKSGKGAVGAYVAHSKRFKWVGFLGILSAFLIMSFYSVLGGYCIKYIVVNIGNIFSSTSLPSEQIFTNLLTNQPESIIYTLIFMVITCVIVMGGISGGIEKFSKIAMPALFIFLVITIIRAVTLPGAGEGLTYMFKPNFEPLRTNFVKVLSSAGGQMFFSLSLGMGCMITYGSYLSKKESLEKNAIIVPAADTIVALLAGIAVLPAAFALGGEGAALGGPSLLFVTLQGVFAAMGGVGPIFGVLFYLLVLIAAITSAISLVEVATTYFIDRAESKGRQGKRKQTTVIVCVAIIVLATIVAADGLGSNGLWVP
ncbi:MAG: sodium-dependent transporter, partial [Clostridiales bacterium]|nr:sodium-dependent transporter [Clostridiales bacterium]